MMSVVASRRVGARRWCTASCALVLAVALRHGDAQAETIGAAAVSSDVSSAKQNEAKKRFARGLELFKGSDYAGALVEFRGAYALSPTYQVLYNIGQVSLLLQDYAGALRELQRYLADGGSEIPPARRGAVEKDLETIRARVGTLTIRTNLPDATVFVDGAEIGKTPLRDAVIVSAGPRRISAILDGKPAAVRNVMVAGAEVATVELSFPMAGTQDAATPSAYASDAGAPSNLDPSDSATSSRAATSARAVHYDTRPIDDAPRAKVPSWPFWATAGGLATAAGILGIAALRSASDLEHGRNTLGTTRQSLDATRSRAAELALAADIATAAAFVCGGLGLYVSLTNRAASHWTSHQATEDHPSVGIELRAGALELRGAF